MIVKKNLLAKGLKFAITPDKTRVDDYIVPTELVQQRLMTYKLRWSRSFQIERNLDPTSPKRKDKH